MIHEKQVRQLCAVHTVNNLLQIPSDIDYCCDRDREGCRHDCDQECVAQCEHATVGQVETSRVGDCVGALKTTNVHSWTCLGQTICRCYISPHRHCEKCSCTLAVKSDKSEQNKKITPKSANSNSKRWVAATQSEFDDIAKEFTIRERMLMEGTEPNTHVEHISDISQQENDSFTAAPSTNRLSFMQRINNQYGTPYFGNYSLEVIETALHCRGVEIEFFRVPDDTQIVVETLANYDTSANDPCIGFVVHEENRSNSGSIFSRIGNRIPLIRSVCGVGRHWYAITRVQYHKSQTANSCQNNANAFVKGVDGIVTSEGNDETSSKKDHTSGPSYWFLVDSDQSEISKFSSHEELVHYLREVEKGGGLVFRATCCVEGNVNTHGNEPTSNH